MITQAVTDKDDFRKMDKAEPGWLYELRNRAWRHYSQSPLPDRIKNIWRYTRPDSFLIGDMHSVMNLPPFMAEINIDDDLPDDSELAAVGFNRSDLSMTLQRTHSLKEAGFIIKDLHSASIENREIVEKYLGKLVSFDFDKFEALNLALWNSGMFLYIPDNQIIENPIYLHRHPTGNVTMARLLVVMGKNSQATIIDDYKCHCPEGKRVVHSAVEIVAGDAARVRYVNLQRLDPESNTYITQRTQLGANAESYSVFVSLGGAVSKINAGTVLNGRGANSHIYGVAIGDGKQHFDHHTLHHHAAPSSYSNIDFKVVLKDKTVSAYTGLIKIEKEALNCEAYQENRNLLLAKGAKAESIPELEILTDQVRCTHGATVGPVDPEMVFYLQSRGISAPEATRLIVAGFIEPTIDKIPPGVSELFKDIIHARLEEI
jgi:Fe-S cluster assembly protein SufD